MSLDMFENDIGRIKMKYCSEIWFDINRIASTFFCIITFFFNSAKHLQNIW